jgi:glycolate oxidase iron-sulfur subunit
LSLKIRELSVFLFQRSLAEQLKKRPWRGGPVAYHDPCKAQYGQRVIDPPRYLLNAIPQLKLIPVPEADQCCGGGGTYSLVHPEMSAPVLDAKVKNILSTGARVVVTSSASCLVQLSHGLRRHGDKVEALHLSEFLMRAIQQGQ